MKGPGYPAGVPTPFVAHVHPYPTRFHGAIWTRPQFAFPQMQTPQSVFIPGRDIEMMPDKPYTGSGMQGLGELQYNVGDGIFKPGGYGGGVFDGNLSGAPPLGKRGQTSMGALGDASRARGIRSVYLQVLKANAPARGLYERLGFSTHHEYDYLAR